MSELISAAEAWEQADPWQRVRLALREHEMAVAHVAAGGAAALVNSRNRLLEAIGEYAKSERDK